MMLMRQIFAIASIEQTDERTYANCIYWQNLIFIIQ